MKSLPKYIDKFIEPILIGVSLVCLAGFLWNTFTMKTIDPQGIPLANLKYGNAERKSAGNTSFQSIVPEAALYNRDVLWILEGNDALLQFTDGSRMNVKGGSYIVLNRSLIHPGKNGKVELLVGAVEILKQSFWAFASRSELEVEANGKSYHLDNSEDKLEVTSKPSPTSRPPQVLPSSQVPSPEPSTSESPMPSSTPSPEKRGKQEQPASKSSDIHPKPESILLHVGKKPAIITFAWPTALNGTLEIYDTQNKKIVSTAVTSERSKKITLPDEATYSWKVIDSSGQSPFGTNTFRLFSGKKHQLGDLLKTETKSTIEFIQ
jgi:hypothetical protein